MKLSGKAEFISELLTHGVPKTQIAKILKVNRMTADSFIKREGIEIKNDENRYVKCEVRNHKSH